jgi:UPF0716 protein FxsA
MNVAKWLLVGVLALPVAEVAVFIAVAAAYGFFQAIGLQALATLGGIMLLRHAGGNHIARVRMAMKDGVNQSSFSALQADGTGGLILLAGILLVIPGFITDIAGLLLLLAPLWRAVNRKLGRAAPPGRTDGVVDLEPEQWHRVDDPALPGRRPDKADGQG